MHICAVKGCGYGATEKINFWRVMKFFKNGCHFEPEVEYTYNVALVQYYFFALSRLHSIGFNYCGL